MRLPASVPPWALYALLGAGLYVALRGVNGAVKDTARTVAKLPGSVIEGLVTGGGESVGIPQTDMNQCQRDLAAGRKWDASFSCPASKFLKHLFD